MTVAELTAETLQTVTEESQLLIIWRRFKRHRLALAGLGVVLFFIVAVILAPVITPYDPISDMELGNPNAPPSAVHIMGTDQLGRDVFSRLGRREDSNC